MSSDRFQVGGLVVAAIGDHQLDAGRLAGRDHRLGFGHVGRHRLLAKHVFAGFGRADRVLGVHRVGQCHIDRLDGRVVRDFIEVLVIVDGACRNPVLGRDPLRLVAMAAYEPGDLGGGGAAHGRHEVTGDAAEADDAVAGLPRGGLGMQIRDKPSCQAECAQLGEVSTCQIHGDRFSLSMFSAAPGQRYLRVFFRTLSKNLSPVPSSEGHPARNVVFFCAFLRAESRERASRRLRLARFR